MKRLHFSILVYLAQLILTADLFGQMHGYYSVGGLNADFSTLPLAISELQTQGVSDSVILQIQPGLYSGDIAIDKPIPNITANRPVIFESSNHDPESVIFQSSKPYTIYLYEQYHLIFRHLTFRNTRDHTNTYTVDIHSSSALIFSHCNISLDCPSPATATTRGSLHINHQSATRKPQGILLDSILFTGNGNGLEIESFDDLITVKNSNFSTTGVYSFKIVYADQLTFIRNNFKGKIEGNYNNIIKFYDNIVDGETDLIHGEFINNVFYQNTDLSGWIADSNIFHSSLRCDVLSIRNNTIHKNIYVSYVKNLLLENNICYGNVSLSYCEKSTVKANTLFNGASLSFCDESYVSNCLLFDELRISISPKCRVYNNNFSLNSRLRINSNEGTVKNNNFSQEIYVESFLPIILNNNYFPKGGILDSNPFSINPFYENDSSLIAKNPLLIGKGVMLAAVTTDFLGLQRPIPPTLGANEICIDVDSLEIPCGEKILLNICGLPLSGDFHWSPVNGLDNPNSRKPIATVDTSILYHVIDSITGWKDSILIKTFPIKDFIINDSLKILCGQNVRLGTYEHSTASWLWIPDTGLSSDTIRNPIAQPFSSVVYHVLMAIPGCPTYQDSTIIDTDSLPLANLGIEGESPVVQFRNYSTCADSYKWIFGDDSTSTEFEPSHEYTMQGYYSVLLVANNIFGSDTTGTFIYITITSIKSPEIDTTWNLYPNPASNFVVGILPKNEKATVNHLAIFDLNGKIKIEKYYPQTLEHQFVVDLSELTSGLYICQVLLNSGKLLNQKLVVIK